MLGLYIHIPFCVQKCKYCDFNSYKIEKDKKKGEEKNNDMNIADNTEDNNIVIKFKIEDIFKNLFK